MSLQSPAKSESSNLPNVKHSIVPTLKAPISSVLPTTVYTDSLGKQKLREKKQKAKEITSVGTSTAFARTIIMQSLWLFYRTPIKLFRPLRVDYLVMARALMPVNETNKRFSFRYTSIGMITNAVKAQGWKFIPRHIMPPLIANTFIGTVLYTTYIGTLPLFHPASNFQLHRTFPPPPFSAVFMAGALAGAAQCVVATPLDSLKVRFEVTDLLEGKHRSMYQYAKSTLKELGLFSAYRGFTLTLARDSLACGLFFATFEWVKQQGYYNFLDEVYGYQIDSSEALTKVDSSWNHSGFLNHDEENDHASIQAAALSLVEDTVREKPPLLLEPIFVIAAGAAAAVAYQAIDHPLSKIHNVFYITEAQSEFANPRCRESTRKLYRETWERCKMQVRLTGGSWRKYLYQDFTGVLVKVAPATSLGFLVFELAKREIDFRSQ
ncbi:hypothetical protein INT44_001623 [Umbelopsis vinacea]|uniref:Mitochondrial carrier n=1 Tax=Umbelopsis vinacea TaxID=44442 RepID=A0A8H7PSJ7_9FUNG|nr:hypothetical protein INT44_001623 [Umbelopsis vinacea]KAI9284214.1 mitochondrial carrier domain-containing protein [Umbelopsis sp. AD052]